MREATRYLVIVMLTIVLPGLLLAQHDYEYKGVDACETCHSGVITKWEGTAHATAFDSASSYVQNTDRCLSCHTTGWDTTETAVPNGFDDYFFADDTSGMEKLRNVQCESCHTPTEEGAPLVTHAAENCGQCHQGSHHPTYTDWEKSLHAVAKFTSRPEIFSWIASDSSCAGCHTAEGFVQFIDQDALEPHVDPPGAEGSDLTCSACHQPHDGSIDGQLRMDKTELCSKCHNPEYNPDSPPEPDGSAVHHSTAYMFEGKGGYEYEGYEYESSAHTFAVGEKCVACHVFTKPYEEGPPEVPAYTGHTFEPVLESCVECHSDFAVEDSTFDYRGVQSEIDSLMNVLHGKLEMASPEDSTSDAFYRAKFNYDFVHAEGSHGIHNTDYAKGLLTSSIENFEPTAIEPVSDITPMQFALNQNYPNPFNPVTTIEFAVAKVGHVEITVFNSLGRQVETLVDEMMNTGQYKVKFNAGTLSSGVYFYRIQVHSDAGAQFSDVRKMVIMK